MSRLSWLLSAVPRVARGPLRVAESPAQTFHALTRVFAGCHDRFRQVPGGRCITPSPGGAAARLSSFSEGCAGRAKSRYLEFTTIIRSLEQAVGPAAATGLKFRF